MIHTSLLPGAALLAAGIAAAQGIPGEVARSGPQAEVTRAQVIERADQRFARLDADHDGRFTREEGQALRDRRHAAMADRIFDRIDADHNGSITREEMSQARGQRQARRGERMADGPGGPPPPRMHGPDGPRDHGMRGHRGRPGPRMAMRMLGEQGFITRAQFRQHALERFDRADADHNGTLTAAERHSARPHRGMGMRHGPDGSPPPGGDDGDF